MPLAHLDNLVRIGQLKAEPAAQVEIDGLVRSGKARLKDAGNATNSLEGRFDLAYNAAHALSLAALRWHGYRSENRYLVFQSLTHTLNIAPEQWRILDQARVSGLRLTHTPTHIRVDLRLENEPAIDEPGNSRPGKPQRERPT